MWVVQSRACPHNITGAGSLVPRHSTHPGEERLVTLLDFLVLTWVPEVWKAKPIKIRTYSTLLPPKFSNIFKKSQDGLEVQDVLKVSRCLGSLKTSWKSHDVLEVSRRLGSLKTSWRSQDVLEVSRRVWVN